MVYWTIFEKDSLSKVVQHKLLTQRNPTLLCACRFLRSSHAPLRLLCTYYVRLLSVAQSSSFAHQFHLGIMKNHCIDSWAGRILWKMRATSCWGFIIIVCCWIIASSPNSPAHPIYIELCCFTLQPHHWKTCRVGNEHTCGKENLYSQPEPSILHSLLTLPHYGVKVILKLHLICHTVSIAVGYHRLMARTSAYVLDELA